MKIINKQRLDALRVGALNALNETHGYLNYNFDNLTILSSDEFDSITIDNIINKPHLATTTISSSLSTYSPLSISILNATSTTILNIKRETN